MTWNYRIIKRASENEPEYYYALNEVFYEKNGTLVSFSDADVTQLLVEYTLEVKNEAAHAIIADLAE